MTGKNVERVPWRVLQIGGGWMLRIVVALATPLHASEADSGLGGMCDLPRVASRLPSVRLAASSAPCCLGPLVAAIDPTLFGQMAFGDSDHDGWNEVFLYIREGNDFFHRVLEEQGGNVYEIVHDGPRLLPYVVGDLDGDAKAS
jgi:hypothetical protein